MDIREALSLLFRHWRIGLLCLITPVLISIVAFNLVSPRYSATAKILIRVGREASSVDQFRSESAGARGASPQEVLSSELEIVTSAELVRAIAVEFAGRLTCNDTGEATRDLVPICGAS